MLHSKFIPDKSQNYWQMTSIQSASLGLPMIAAASHIARSSGTFVAISSILIGNLILWLIGFSIISMTKNEKKNAIDNVKFFMGISGEYLAATVLILSFLSWYILQISQAMSGLGAVLPIGSSLATNDILRFGTAIGFISALVSIKGIVIIRKICTYIFPFLLAYILYVLFMKSEGILWINSPEYFSLYGIITIVTIFLPGVVNFPTFFRHSKSYQDSILALTFTMIFLALFQFLALLLGIGYTSSFLSSRDADAFSIFFASFFILSSYLCCNIVNIYFASATTESIFKRYSSGKEFAIIGLMGTAAYTFMQVSTPMLFLQTFTNDVIGALGVVLIVAFVIKLFVKHRPRKIEKTVNVLCWIVGSAIGTTYQIMFPNDPNGALLATMGATLVSFLVAIFIEETIWSGKILLERNFAWFEE